MMQQSPTFLFAGGGTGGHLFPGVAVAAELQNWLPRARMLFVGSGRSLEREIVCGIGYEHHELPVEPSTLLRKRPLRFLWRNWRAFRAADTLLQQTSPATVVGLGGFASAPVVLAAARRKVPVVLLEQNVIPGRATLWLSRFADLICLAFEQTREKLPDRARIDVPGNPVRREISMLHDELARRSASSRPMLLVLGGSQGAVAVNEAVLSGVAQLRPLFKDWRVLHQAGAAQVESVQRRYAELRVEAVVAPFFQDMADVYRQATVVVSRAGATTLAELACAGTAAVLVPYPHAVANHQWHNARVFELAGAAQLVEQQPDAQATADALSTALESWLIRADVRSAAGDAMQTLARPEAARDVADRLLELSGLGRSRAEVPAPHFQRACVPTAQMHNVEG